MDINGFMSINDCEIIAKTYLNNDDVKVLDFTISRFSVQNLGYMGEHYILTIVTKPGGYTKECRFFLKLFPRLTNTHNIGFLKTVRAFEREIFFYKEIIKAYQDTIPNYEASFVPKYYLGRTNDFIVLEDLTCKEYSLAKLPELADFDKDHINLVIKAVAKLHAGSLAYEELMSKRLGQKFTLVHSGNEHLLDEATYKKCEDFSGYVWLKTALDGLLALLEVFPVHGLTVEGFKQKLSDLFNDSFEILKSQNKFRNVLCHRDVWSKNVMFSYENNAPVDAKLVDFQLVRYFIPAHDILNLIYLTTTQKTRQQHFIEFLKLYYSCLSEQLEKYGMLLEDVISFVELRDSINFLLPQIKLARAFQLMYQCVDRDVLKQLLNMDSISEEYIYQNRCSINKLLFERDRNFHDYMFEAIDELKSMVLGEKLKWEIL